MNRSAMKWLWTLAALTACGGGGGGPERPYMATIEKVAGRVGFYSQDGRRLGQVKVGAYPHEGVLSADGRLLYVSDNGVLWMTDQSEGGNTISIVDVDAMKKVGTIDLGQYRRPHGLALDPSTGHLFSTVENPFGLVMIDTATRRVLRFFDVHGDSPHMVILGPDAQVAYVSDTGTGVVAAIRLDTGETKVIPTGARPQGGVFSPSGDTLYITNSDADTISIIDVDSQKVIGEIATDKHPNRIAVTPDGGTLVYSMQYGNSVGFADVATRKQTTTVPLGGPPLSLTMARDGQRAFSGVQEQDKVFVISVPERKIIQMIQLPKGSGPDPCIPLGDTRGLSPGTG